jgi:hypothetical protein
MTPDELAQAYAHAGSLERLAEQLGCSASAAMNRLRRAGVARRRVGRPLSRRMELAVELLRLYREAGERLRPRLVARWAGIEATHLLTSYRRTYGPISGRRRSR